MIVKKYKDTIVSDDFSNGKISAYNPPNLNFGMVRVRLKIVVRLRVRVTVEMCGQNVFLTNNIGYMMRIW